MSIKVLILVLTAKSGDFPMLEETARNTWGSIKNEDIEIFYYHGASPKDEIVGDTIYSTSPEGYHNVGKKTLTAFELLKNKEFDYLFRTNTSSYIVQENLLKFLENKPRQNYYSGIQGSQYNIDYCSGSGYLISRDVFEKVIQYKKFWNHQLIDDVAIGNLIKSFNVKISEGATRLNIHDLERPYELCDLKNHYHIRCAWHRDRNVDVFHMKNIHKLLNN